MFNEYFPEDSIEVFMFMPFRKDKHVWIIDTNLTINNTGEKIAKNIEIFIRVPRPLDVTNLGEVKLEGGTIKGLKHETLYSDKEEYPVVHTMKVDDIKSNQKLNINFPFVITMPTNFESEVEAKTKDNVNVTLAYEAHYSYIIDVSVYPEEGEQINQRYNLRILDCSKTTPRDQIIEMSKDLGEKFSKEYEKECDTITKKLMFHLNKNHPLRSSPKNLSVIIFDGEVKRKDLYKDLVYSPKKISITSGVRFSNFIFVPTFMIKK